jgi:hypothetical protein
MGLDVFDVGQVLHSTGRALVRQKVFASDDRDFQAFDVDR